MKKILLIGYDFNYEKDVAKKYKDTLFIEAHEIECENNPDRVIAMVDMVDAVLLMERGCDSKFIIAAKLMNKDIYLPEDYPVSDEKADEKGEEENA